jgi:hypothetical protein
VVYVLVALGLLGLLGLVELVLKLRCARSNELKSKQGGTISAEAILERSIH